MLARSLRSRRRSFFFGRAGTALVVLGASLSVSVGVTAPAHAAPANCLDTIYVTDNLSGDVLPVSLAGAVGAAAYDATPGTATAPNQLGIGADGAYAISAYNDAGTPRILEQDLVANTSTDVVKPTAATVSGIAGAINPANGFYYFGGYTNSVSPLVLWAYDPSTNITVGPVASITVPSTPTSAGNGDLAFASDGTLYLVAASADTTNLYRVDAQLPTTTPQQSSTATLLTSTTGLSAASNGIAFASDGHLYLGTLTTLQKVNPITGALVGAPIPFTGASVNSTDLGTCAGPNTIEAGVTLPDNRLAPGDQFTTTVTGGSYANPPTFPSGTTEGTDSGPQTLPPETAGPGLVLPGETYTVEVTGAPGTDIDDYATNFECTDAAGIPTRSGQGTSVTITPTSGVGVSETCTFTVQNPVNLTKSVSPTIFDAVGDQLTYTFVASNDDSVALGNFQLDDPLPGLGPITCAPFAESAPLPAGASTTCTATYTITAADVQSGATKNNTATVTTDPRPGTTRVSTATSSVTAANAATPVVANDDTAATPYATPVSLDGSADDVAGTSPIDNSTTVFTDLAATNGGKQLITPEGTWEVLGDGRVRFTPATGYSGTTPAVEYQVTDGNGFADTANLTVTVRTGPTATPDMTATPQDTTVSLNPTLNDIPGARTDGTAGAFDLTTLVFPTTGQPGPVTNAGRTLTVPGVGAWTIDPDTGVVSFNPEPAFDGVAQVTYQVADQAGNTVFSTITVTVTATPVPAAIQVPEDDSFDLALSKRVVSGAQATVGAQVRYRLQVSNKGPAAAPAPIKLNDPLPDGLELVSARGKGWKCTVRKAADTVTCVRNRTLGADRKAPAVFVVAVATKAAMGRVVNVANVRVAGETAGSKDRDKASITVVPAQLPSTGFRAVPPGI